MKKDIYDIGFDAVNRLWYIKDRKGEYVSQSLEHILCLIKSKFLTYMDNNLRGNAHLPGVNYEMNVTITKVGIK